MDSKTTAELMQEEKEKLQSEINEKIKNKKSFMTADEPVIGFQNSSKT